MKQGTVIVGGFIGILSAGGVTWDYIQYVLGFKKLGFEVIYLEDTMLYPIYQKKGQRWDDSRPVISNLMAIMERFGLGDKWIYRDEVTGSSFGMDLELFKAICKQADFFVNVSCATIMRDEYAAIPHRILIDSDPMFTQIQLNTQQSFTSKKSSLKKLAQAHNHFFTFGENINDKNCRIPETGFEFIPTRQPIELDFWKVKPLDLKAPITTLMNWSAGKTLKYEGENWGQKDMEFYKIKSIPKQFEKERFKIAVNKTASQLGEADREVFFDNNWKLLNPDKASKDESTYQKFIYNSKAELSVAKHTYVHAKTGWFSCRSACYLASGRPVITQDTGWSNFYTTGIGLFKFNTAEEVEIAIDLINRDPSSQSDAARQIAEAYFDSNKVLSAMIDQVSVEHAQV